MGRRSSLRKARKNAARVLCCASVDTDEGNIQPKDVQAEKIQQMKGKKHERSSMPIRVKQWISKKINGVISKFRRPTKVEVLSAARYDPEFKHRPAPLKVPLYDNRRCKSASHLRHSDELNEENTWASRVKGLHGCSPRLLFPIGEDDDDSDIDRTLVDFDSDDSFSELQFGNSARGVHQSVALNDLKRSSTGMGRQRSPTPMPWLQAASTRRMVGQEQDFDCDLESLCSEEWDCPSLYGVPCNTPYPAPQPKVSTCVPLPLIANVGPVRHSPPHVRSESTDEMHKKLIDADKWGEPWELRSHHSCEEWSNASVSIDDLLGKTPSPEPANDNGAVVESKHSASQVQALAPPRPQPKVSHAMTFDQVERLQQVAIFHPAGGGESEPQILSLGGALSDPVQKSTLAPAPEPLFRSTLSEHRRPLPTRPSTSIRDTNEPAAPPRVGRYTCSFSRYVPLRKRTLVCHDDVLTTYQLLQMEKLAKELAQSSPSQEKPHPNAHDFPEIEFTIPEDQSCVVIMDEARDPTFYSGSVSPSNSDCDSDEEMDWEVIVHRINARRPRGRSSAEMAGNSDDEFAF